MLGFKSFESAAVVIGGVELAEKIKKGQFKLAKPCRAATMPENLASCLGCLSRIILKRKGRVDRIRPHLEFAPEPVSHQEPNRT
jgi:hypothetical protein